MAETDCDEWIPLRQGVVEVAQAYSCFMLCEPPMALETAQEAILRRIQFYFAKSRAKRWILNFPKTEEFPHHRRDDSEGPEIPGEFWAVFQSADSVIAEDWIAGEYSFARSDEGAPLGIDAFGMAIGVEVTRKGLPLIGDNISEGGISGSTVNGFKRMMEERRGARRKWDWEGAICATLAQANNDPDGLPAGHGAQAEIGRILSRWFQEHQGDEPVASEIGLRASKIVQAIESHRK